MPLLPPLLPGPGTRQTTAAGGRTRFADDLGPAPPPQPVFDCSVILTAPSFVPVNAFDYNGSPVTPPDAGIPAKRDFDVAPLPGPDPLLLAASVEVQCPVAGSLNVSIGVTGTGNIDLWMDQRKQQPFSPSITTTPTDQVIPFYIEGKHESSALNDVTLIFTFTYAGGPQGQLTTTRAQQQITVTPLINDYTDREAGGANGQNIFFDVGQNANGGLATQPPNAQPGAANDGMYFHASLNDTNLPGAGRLVQNATQVGNGANGDTTYGGANVGWLYASGATDANANPIGAADLIVSDGAPFPLLDLGPNDTAPEYKYDWAILNITGDTYEFEVGDSPSTGNPVNSQLGTTVDVIYRFRTWLLWRYVNYVGNGTTFVYYPIAYADWTVSFWATASKAQSGPIDTINTLHGVMGTPYVRSNSAPFTMSPTVTVNGQQVSNIFNGNLAWGTIR